MEFEPMLTPREKSPLPENVPRGGSNPRHCGQRAQALPTELFRPSLTLTLVLLCMCGNMSQIRQCLLQAMRSHTHALSLKHTHTLYLLLNTHTKHTSDKACCKRCAHKHTYTCSFSLIHKHTNTYSFSQTHTHSLSLAQHTHKHTSDKACCKHCAHTHIHMLFLSHTHKHTSIQTQTHTQILYLAQHTPTPTQAHTQQPHPDFGLVIKVWQHRLQHVTDETGLVVSSRVESD